MKFSDEHRAQGFFWDASKPEQKLPGDLVIKEFPKATCLSLEHVDLKNRSSLLHGVTEEGESVTLFKASWSLSATGTRPDRIDVYGDHLLVGDGCYDETRCVRRLSMSSSIAETVFQLWPGLLYSHLKFVERRGQRLPVTVQRTVSYYDLESGKRFSIFSPTVPEAKSSFRIDFINLVTIEEALEVLREFTNLLSMICGVPIDPIRTTLKIQKDGRYEWANMYSYQYPQKTKTPYTNVWSPTIDFAKDRQIFRQVMRCWLKETETKRAQRGAFIMILRDDFNVRATHLRDLVTIIEMYGRAKPPLTHATFKSLISALSKALHDFAEAFKDASWCALIEERLEHLNGFDLATILNKFIDDLPKDIVKVPDDFVSAVKKFRNKSVHDFSKLTKEDYAQLGFLIAKLQAILVVRDMIDLGVLPGQILVRSKFISQANAYDRMRNGPSSGL